MSYSVFGNKIPVSSKISDNENYYHSHINALLQTYYIRVCSLRNFHFFLPAKSELGVIICLYDILHYFKFITAPSAFKANRLEKEEAKCILYASILKDLCMFEKVREIKLLIFFLMRPDCNEKSSSRFSIFLPLILQDSVILT